MYKRGTLRSPVDTRLKDNKNGGNGGNGPLRDLRVIPAAWQQHMCRVVICFRCLERFLSVSPFVLFSLSSRTKL